MTRVPEAARGRAQKVEKFRMCEYRRKCDVLELTTLRCQVQWSGGGPAFIRVSRVAVTCVRVRSSWRDPEDPGAQPHHCATACVLTVVT